MIEIDDAARTDRVGVRREAAISRRFNSAIARSREGASGAVTLQTLARWSFAATVIALPFRTRWVLLARPLPPVYGDYTNLLIFPSDVCLAATLLLWLGSWLLQRRCINWGPLWLSTPVAVMIAWSALSAAFAVDPMLAFYNVAHFVLLAGLALYVLNEIKTLNALIVPVAVLVFIQATIGVAQVLQQHSIGLQSLGELELDPAWRGVSIVSANGLRSLRAYGLTDHPNILGGCLAFALALIAGWYAQARPRGQALTISVFALGVATLLLTFSRSAWVALAGAMILSVLVLLKTRQAQALKALIGLGGAALIVVAPFAWQNLDNLGVRLNRQNSFTNVAAEDQALGERNLLNDIALHLLADRPLTGVGLGVFPTAFRQAIPDYAFNYQPPHLAVLDAAAEIGLPGAIAYLAILIGPWLALLIHRRRLRFSPALIGASSVLLAVTLVGLFDYYTWMLAPGRLWQWLIWGLWAAMYQSAQRRAA